MSMKKVLHIGCRYYPYIGGSTLRLSRILEAASYNNDYDFFVMTTEQGEFIDNIGISSIEDINGVKVIRVKNYYRDIFKIVNWIKQNRIEIIHAHNPRIAFPLMMLISNVPILVEIHSLHKMNIIKKRLVSFILKYSKRVIVLSDNAKHIMAKMYNLGCDKLSVVRNGIEVKKFEKKLNNNSLHNNVITVGYIGTMYEWQGVIDLINASKLVIEREKNVKFIFIGDGPELDRLKDFSHDLQLGNNVEITGPVEPGKVPEYMETIDIIVMPRPSNLSTETVTPLKIYEAMAAKKAIIISEVGGLLEVLEPNKDCLSFVPSDVEALAKCVIKLLRDNELRIKIAENAYKKVENIDDWNSVSEKLISIYDSIKM